MYLINVLDARQCQKAYHSQYNTAISNNSALFLDVLYGPLDVLNGVSLHCRSNGKPSDAII